MNIIVYTCINTSSPSTSFAFSSVTDCYFAALGALELRIRLRLDTPENKRSLFIIQNIALPSKESPTRLAHISSIVAVSTSLSSTHFTYCIVILGCIRPVAQLPARLVVTSTKQIWEIIVNNPTTKVCVFDLVQLEDNKSV